MEKTFEALRALNLGYAIEHTFTESDYRKALYIKDFIERLSDEKLIAKGDVVRYIDENGDYYENARVDNSPSWGDDDKIYLCERPYVPFVCINRENYTYSLSMSGGAFKFIDKSEFKYIGKTEALFTDWGHCGARANGAIQFPVEVNLWSVNLRKGKFAEYTKKDYEMVRIFDNRDEYGLPSNGSHYGFIGEHEAWKDEEELNEFLEMFKAVEDTESAYAWGKNKVYWIYKRKRVSVFEKQEFDEIPASAYKALFNGRMVNHKAIIDDTNKTATIYVDRSNETRYRG